MRRTRTGRAWIAICATVAVLIALVVFIAQNSEPVEVSFLVWHGRFPLAVALLSAAASAGVMAAGIGSARIIQLRRVWRRPAAIAEPAAVQGGGGNASDTLEIPLVDVAQNAGGLVATAARGSATPDAYRRA